jgi:hypothetical protein
MESERRTEKTQQVNVNVFQKKSLKILIFLSHDHQDQISIDKIELTIFYVIL